MTTDQAVAATRAANSSDPAADDMRRLFNNRTAATTASASPLPHDSRPEAIALRDEPGLATQSIGEEPNRRVVVLPRNVRRASRVSVPLAEPTVA
jgi:hypothetical protein